jgi:integrase
MVDQMKFEPRELTAKWVESVEKLLDAGQRVEVFDTVVSGLSIRIGRRKSAWCISYKLPGKSGVTRFVIGELASMDCKSARAIGSGLLHRIHKDHHNPLLERRQGRAAAAEKNNLTFKDLVERFLADWQTEGAKGSGIRPDTKRTYESILRNERWERSGVNATPAADVTKDQLEGKVFAPLRKQHLVTARRYFTLVKGMYTWACGVPELNITANPLAHIKNRGKDNLRKRWLSPDELAIFWRAIDRLGHTKPIAQLLVLTGQRTNDIEGLCWSEIRDLDGAEPMIVIPPERFKTGREQVVPLAPPAVAILRALRKGRKPRQELVFSVTGNSASRLGTKDKLRMATAIAAVKPEMVEAGLLSEERAARAFSDPAGWVWHDLRRTVETHLSKIGVARDVAAVLTGHVLGDRIRQTYQMDDLADAKADAAVLWAKYHAALVEAESQAERDRIVDESKQRLRKLRMSLAGIGVEEATVGQR